MGLLERRQHSRISYYTEAWLEGLDVSTVPGRLADLSEGGAFVDARTTLPSGSRARLRFVLADRPIHVTVEVRYVAPGIGMGLRFLGLSEPDRDFIAAFIQGRSADGGVT